MIKSIYEEATELMKLNILPRESGKTAKTKVIHALQQAQKQEKLLELYRELDDCIVAPNGHHVCRYTDDEKYARIRKQIKELENE